MDVEGNAKIRALKLEAKRGRRGCKAAKSICQQWQARFRSYQEWKVSLKAIHMLWSDSSPETHFLAISSLCGSLLPHLPRILCNTSCKKLLQLQLWNLFRVNLWSGHILIAFMGAAQPNLMQMQNSREMGERAAKSHCANKAAHASLLPPPMLYNAFT